MTTPVISLQDVTVAFDGQVVLEQINLQVEPGRFVAIIGPNGAGKTTLLRVILGLVKPVLGTVRVFGKPPEALGDDRTRIGYVPQVLSVDLKFPITAGEVVLMGLYGRLGLLQRPSRVHVAQARQAMARVGVEDLWYTPFGALSGGQRQRVLMARALVNNPDLLILDEPTTGVDVVATDALYTLLRTFHDQGMTILVVSHDVGVVASFVDTIACINRRLVAHGRPGDVLGSDQLAQMYGCDVALFTHGRVPHIVVDMGEVETETDVEADF